MTFSARFWPMTARPARPMRERAGEASMFWAEKTKGRKEDGERERGRK